MAVIGNYSYNIYNRAVLWGTDSADTIHGYGGNDELYGGLGNDLMYGGPGNDNFYPTSQAYQFTTAVWGNDTVYGGAGNDLISYDDNQDTSYLFGEDGEDWIFGGGARDYIYGGNHDDLIQGNAGHDYLVGGAGDDYILGGYGSDDIIGGPGADLLTGYSGGDFFHFKYGDTGITSATADTITDWNRTYDWIDGPFVGTTSNYRETTNSYATGFDAARAWAVTQINATVKYAFVTDSVNGYLFGDLNNDNWIDSAVTLKGVTHVDQFMASDIL